MNVSSGTFITQPLPVRFRLWTRRLE